MPVAVIIWKSKTPFLTKLKIMKVKINAFSLFMIFKVLYHQRIKINAFRLFMIFKVLYHQRIKINAFRLFMIFKVLYHQRIYK